MNTRNHCAVFRSRIINARPIVVVGTAVLLALAGCKRQNEEAIPPPAPQVVQAVEQKQVQPGLPPFTFDGVHSGMTLAQVKAAGPEYRNLKCSIFYGGPQACTPAVRCFMNDGIVLVDLTFFRTKLFHMSRTCGELDASCEKLVSLMNAHFGRRQSDRKEVVGPSSLRIIRWRSPEESACLAGGKFEVLNYRFAPSGLEQEDLRQLVDTPDRVETGASRTTVLAFSREQR